MESFAGVGNPFALGPRWIRASGSSTSAPGPGSTPWSPPDRSDPSGQVVGVDMTVEMLAKARRTAAQLGLDQVEFREGLAEELPWPTAGRTW